MRPIWLLWYTVYNTFESIVTGASISDAFGNGDVTKCLYETNINVKGIEDCAKSAYKRYLASGPQKPYSECSEMCPGSGVGIDVPEPRSMFFFMTVWLFGMYISLDCLSVQLRKFIFSDGGGGAKPPKFPTKPSNYRQPPCPQFALEKAVFSPLLDQNFRKFDNFP
jgi:hypothetical protein